MRSLLVALGLLLGSLTSSDAQTSAGSVTARLLDGSGAKITSTGGALDLNLKTSSITLPVSVSGSLAAGTNLIGQVEVSDGTNVLGTVTHPIRTDPLGTTTQPVSGAVTANAGTGNFTVQPYGHASKEISSSTTTVVKNGAGILHTITINTTGTGWQVSVCDNTTNCASGQFASFATTSVIVTLQYDVAFSNGLTIVTTGVSPGDLTVSYR